MCPTTQRMDGCECNCLIGETVYAYRRNCSSRSPSITPPPSGSVARPSMPDVLRAVFPTSPTGRRELDRESVGWIPSETMKRYSKCRINTSPFNLLFNCSTSPVLLFRFLDLIERFGIVPFLLVEHGEPCS